MSCNYVNVFIGAQKKTYGVTRCLDLLNMDRRKLLIVDVNDLGQPIRHNARKLASYLGTIAHNPQKSPLTWDDWRKKPAEYKNHMWDLVKVQIYIFLHLLKILILISVFFCN